MSLGTRLRCRTRPLTWSGSLLDWVDDPRGLTWLRHDDGFVAWGEAARLDVPPGPDRFRRASRALADWCATVEVDDAVAVPGTGPVAFGAFTFDPRTAGSVLIVPEVVIARSDGRAWVTAIGDREPPREPAGGRPSDHGRVRYEGSTRSELAWIEAVARAVEEITAGRLEKVVLARDRRVWARAPFDPRLLTRRLQARFPSCWTFSVDGLVGASPELLVRRAGREVTSTVLAGSIARGQGHEEDRLLAEALLASAKERTEHRLAVVSVREVLHRVARDLHVDPEPYLVRLANVQHLATDVRAQVGGLSALDLAGRLHPTAAVCGTPTATAMERIRALEHLHRARYSGPVGWVDGRGDGEWCIALRCAEIDGARARLFAGAGIVAGSLPEAELEETRVKLRAMQSALEDSAL